MALFECGGGGKAKTGTVTVQDNERKHVDLGFRPKYISVIGWNNDASQGVTCVYNQAFEPSYQYRGLFRTSPSTAKLPMPSGSDYVGAIDGIDDTGFYISSASATYSYSNYLFYYTAIG